jgi:hypothetical protein
MKRLLTGDPLLCAYAKADGSWVSDDPADQQAWSDRTLARAGMADHMPLEYFKVEVPNQTVFYCSDNECPCGQPGAEIQRGGGYLYISEELVEFRRDALTLAQLEEKLQRLQQATGAHVFFDQGTIWPILVCAQAARRRGLNIEVAAFDAKRLFETGLVPLRATPKG